MTSPIYQPDNAWTSFKKITSAASGVATESGILIRTYLQEANVTATNDLLLTTYSSAKQLELAKMEVDISVTIQEQALFQRIVEAKLINPKTKKPYTSLAEYKAR